jgi:hypothetical protein
VVLLKAGAAAPAFKHLSPHQHRVESFTLKRDAGEGNQRGGGLWTYCDLLEYEFIHFLNVLDIFNTLNQYEEGGVKPQ